MPGTPATTPRMLIPRYANPDATQYASQMNAASDMIDSKAHKVTARVTSLPGSPTDGDQVILQTAAMQTLGVAWRMRYRSALGFWENLSSSYLHAGNTGVFAPASDGVWSDPSGVLDNQIVAPVSGHYEVYIKLTYQPNLWTFSAVQAGLAVAGGTPAGDVMVSKIVWQGMTPNSSTYIRAAGHFMAFSLVGGTTYGTRYRRILYDEGTRTFSFGDRKMGMRLIRTA